MSTDIYVWEHNRYGEQGKAIDEALSGLSESQRDDITKLIDQIADAKQQGDFKEMKSKIKHLKTLIGEHSVAVRDAMEPFMDYLENEY